MKRTFLALLATCGPFPLVVFLTGGIHSDFPNDTQAIIQDYGLMFAVPALLLLLSVQQLRVRGTLSRDVYFRSTLRAGMILIGVVAIIFGPPFIYLLGSAETYWMKSMQLMGILATLMLIIFGYASAFWILAVQRNAEFLRRPIPTELIPTELIPTEFKSFLALLLAAPFVLTACAEKEFAKGLNSVWGGGAGNAAGAPVFSAESGSDTAAQKQNDQTDVNKPK